MRTMARKAMRIGKTAVFGLGLMVALALMLGATTTALAAVPGDPLELGEVNDIGAAATALIGDRAGGVLQIANKGSGTALNLRVSANQPPLTVNPVAGKATNLDADKLDGQEAADFAPARAYFREVQGAGRANAFGDATARCDPGDLVITGGYRKVDAASTFVADMVPVKGQPNGWQVIWFSSGTADDIVVRVLCADVA